MTGTEILNEANYLVDDEIDSTEALAEINHCIDDLSLEAPFEDVYDIVLPAKTRSITVPSDLINLIEVHLNGVRMKQAKSPFEIASNLEGTPSQYYLLGDTLNFYPLSTLDTPVSLLFNSGYTHLNSLTGTPNIPSRFHIAIVYWLADKFKIMDDELAAAQDFLGKYMMERTRLKEYWLNRGNYWVTGEV